MRITKKSKSFMRYFKPFLRLLIVHSKAVQLTTATFESSSLVAHVLAGEENLVWKDERDWHTEGEGRWLPACNSWGPQLLWFRTRKLHSNGILYQKLNEKLSLVAITQGARVLPLQLPGAKQTQTCSSPCYCSCSSSPYTGSILPCRCCCWARGNTCKLIQVRLWHQARSHMSLLFLRLGW